MILYSSINNRRRVGGLPTRSLIVSHHQLSTQIWPKIVSSYLILTINLDLHLPTKWCWYSSGWKFTSSINHDMVRLPIRLVTANTFYHFLWSAVSSNWPGELSDLFCQRKEVSVLFRTCRHTKGKGIIYFLFSVCLSVVIFFLTFFCNIINLVKRWASVSIVIIILKFY